MVSINDFETSFQTIKQLHNQAFKVVDEAVRLEENEKPYEALEKYKNGVEIIDMALSTPVGLPENFVNVKAQWNEACQMIHKMKRARAEIIQRISILSQNHQAAIDVGTDALVEVNESGRPRTYTELAQALKELQFDETDTHDLELLFQCEGVKLYHIKPNGLVTTTSENSTMRIVCLAKDQKKNLQTTYFIQIIKTCNAVPLQIKNETPDKDLPDTPSPTSSFCIISNPNHPHDNFDGQDESSWIYPLIPGVSPCYRTKFGAFIFPDLEGTECGASFGIIVPKEDEADLLALDLLEAILHGVIIESIEEAKARPPRRMSVVVSENIVKGAQFISRNIIKGAEKTGEFMTYSTPYLISKIDKAPQNQHVPGNVQTTMQVVKNVSGVAANVTGYIAGKVCSSTMALGRYLAPHIQRHGSRLLSKSFGIDEQDANDKMAGVLTIAAGAVEGFSTVYAGLEDSANILGRNISENSVKLIEHKYGKSAGSVAHETFDTVGNVINVSRNVNYITPKGIVKRTAKNAGKAVIEDFRPTLQETSDASGGSLPAAGLYPELENFEMQIQKK
ncbi:protein spartin [Condylostylus longicornis]|uniref:protein spartin n=1 Tax=Condylostylus longicornis TaxID=2530218 RepID=UPI00244E3BBF|nr:protein spartin [Condylostylus longicornis]XP_055375172.1 protein spartin [Condylostylus longicornis]